MKRIISLLAVMALLLCGCAGLGKPEQKQYTATFLTLFDTVTTIVGHAASQEAFTEQTQNLIYKDGQWWIMPEQTLLQAISGGVLK